MVVTYPNYAYSDMGATGDTLAAYVREGGGVICGAWCWYLYGNHLDGEIMDSSFNPFTGRGGNHHADTVLGWYDAAHPVMAGVTEVSDRWRDSLMVNPGATTAAMWDDGEWFVGTKGKVVGINGVPGDHGNWKEDMILIFHNAVIWSRQEAADFIRSDANVDMIVEMADAIEILKDLYIPGHPDLPCHDAGDADDSVVVDAWIASICSGISTCRVSHLLQSLFRTVVRIRLRMRWAAWIAPALVEHPGRMDLHSSSDNDSMPMVQGCTNLPASAAPS